MRIGGPELASEAEVQNTPLFARFACWVERQVACDRDCSAVGRFGPILWLGNWSSTPARRSWQSVGVGAIATALLFRSGKIFDWLLHREQQRRLKLWRLRGAADHCLMGLLFGSGFSARRRIYKGVRRCAWQSGFQRRDSTQPGTGSGELKRWA